PGRGSDEPARHRCGPDETDLGLPTGSAQERTSRNGAPYLLGATGPGDPYPVSRASGSTRLPVPSVRCRSAAARPTPLAAEDPANALRAGASERAATDESGRALHPAQLPPGDPTSVSQGGHPGLVAVAAAAYGRDADPGRVRPGGCQGYPGPQ